jgi:PTH1 family peptidyl-tRNA hydrolase
VLLVVGLGNPGAKYERTRHNAGFWVIDALAQSALWQNQGASFEAEIAKADIFGKQALLVKPQTFMNLSGRAVQKIAHYYKIAPQNWVVIHDDIDVPEGKVKVREGGGHGGHNGIRSIIDCTGVNEFGRIKLGVGRPEGRAENGKNPIVSDWVLQPLSNGMVDSYLQTVMPEVLIRLKGMLDLRNQK